MTRFPKPTFLSTLRVVQMGGLHCTLASSRAVRRGLTATPAQLWEFKSLCHYLNTSILCLTVPAQNLGTPRGPQRYRPFLHHVAHSNHTQSNFSVSTSKLENKTSHPSSHFPGTKSTPQHLAHSWPDTGLLTTPSER